MKMKLVGFWGGSPAHKEAVRKKELQELRKSGYGTAFKVSTLADRVRASMAMKHKLRAAFGTDGADGWGQA